MQPRTASRDCNPSVKETDIFYLRFKFWVGLVNHCVRTKSDVGSIKETFCAVPGKGRSDAGCKTFANELHHVAVADVATQRITS